MTADELEETLRRCADMLDRLNGPDADRDEVRDAKALRAVMDAAESLQAVLQTITYTMRVSK